MPVENEPTGWDKFKQTLPEDKRRQIEEGGEYLATGQSSSDSEPMTRIEPEDIIGRPEISSQPGPTSLSLERFKRALQKIKHLGEE